MTLLDFGKPGEVVYTGLALVELACWDIIGKATNQPVYRLLGGQAIDRVPAYANGWYTVERTPTGFAEAAQKVVARGYRGMKFDPFGNGDLELEREEFYRSLDLIEAVAAVAGTRAQIMIEMHGRFAPHQAREIARQLDMSTDELKHHVEVIRQLDPKPGSRFNESSSQYVIPDVHVHKVEGEYVAALNEDSMPQLRISPIYRRLLDKKRKSDDETRAYVKEKFRSALWLLKSVDQRQKTIRKVATSIVTFQSEFLDRGIDYLRPLVLREVADDIGMHESTVSRVVNNKYMHTPRGVFEMKYFFHSGIDSAYGASVSSLAIKQRIRKIVEKENPEKPLSDARIAGLLRSSGLMLARRTVAKYREELKIPTSCRRKVLF